jgi:hypothetical protein
MSIQEAVRDKSRAFCAKRGVDFNPSLPFLDSPEEYSPPDPTAVAARSLVLGYVVCAGHGAPVADVRRNLDHYGLWNSASPAEQELLSRDTLSRQQVIEATWQVECIQVCAWALNLANLDHFRQCDDGLASLFPIQVDPTFFLRSARLRAHTELYQECDLVYCLHWAARDASLNGTKTPVSLEIIQERRRAIEWLVGSERDWDDISMDT